MNAIFVDFQNDNNPRNGEVINSLTKAQSLLDELRGIRPPIMCQLNGDNGFELVFGIDRDTGCAQYSSNDGTPPFLMAISEVGSSRRDDIVFLVGDTPTPINGRYRIAFDELREIVAEFVTTGQRSAKVAWEELE